ncbi:MAG: efflux RND transporter periplasmic adaptor subunit [Polyangiaceae bacterium]
MADTTLPNPIPATPDPEVAKTLGLGKKQRKWGRWVWIGVLALAVGGGAYSFLGPKKPAAALYVEAPAEKADVLVTVTATGTIQGLSSVEVGAEVSGKITKLYADYNDRVEVGQLLAEIDPELPQAAADQESARLAASSAAIQQAKATVEETRLASERADALAKEGLVSTRDVESAHAAYARAKAQLASANADSVLARASLKSASSKLRKTKIISPVKGIVLSRNVELGQTVTAGFTTPVLFKLTEDLTKMRVSVYIDEADVGRVHEGLDASFTVDAFPDRVFPSKVLSLRYEPKTESNVVSYEAILAVDNKELLLRPGMTASATIVAETKKDVLTVPNAALRFAPPQAMAGGPPGMRSSDAVTTTITGPKVWVLQPGQKKPVAVAVTPGATDGIKTEIVKGDLQPGQQVITDSAETTKP